VTARRIGAAVTGSGMNPLTRSIISWVIIGLLAGFIGSLLAGPGTLVGYLIAGLIGAVVGGFVAFQFNLDLKLGNRFLAQIILSAIGAIIVMIVAEVAVLG
jgi:uncharacterized membrane protein YeaQ/YmgE (transglycosylase-associated protein family)